MLAVANTLLCCFLFARIEPLDRSTIESAVVFLVFVVVYFLADSFNLQELNRRYTRGTAPAVKTNRLRFHFSLRTLLAAMTLAAIGTVLVVYALR